MAFCAFSCSNSKLLFQERSLLTVLVMFARSPFFRIGAAAVGKLHSVGAVAVAVLLPDVGELRPVGAAAVTALLPGSSQLAATSSCASRMLTFRSCAVRCLMMLSIN